MSNELDAWLSPQKRAICISPSYAFDDFKKQIKHIESNIYPSLWRGGWEIPLNIVIDLALLYLEGPDVVFHPPASWPEGVDKYLAYHYCRHLNEETAKDPLRYGVLAARRAVRQRNIDPAWADTRQMPGLRMFLEMIATELCAIYSAAEKRRPAPREVRTAIVSGTFNPPPAGRLDSKKLTLNGELFLKSFLESLFPNDLNEGARPFARALQSKARILLTVADVHEPEGPEGMDLPLLESCMAYTPLELDATSSARHRRLHQALNPKQNRVSRSPESGNQGITTRGTPTAVLRSYMARPDFIERLYMHQALYYDRRAPRDEPHRILLAWILDQGEKMWLRSSINQRFDSVARRIAAFVIEDAVRHFIEAPALAFRVAVLLHNGDSVKPRGRLIMPPPDLLHEAPQIDETKKEKAPIWLPKLDGFLPYFFLREPVWPHKGKDPTGLDPFHRYRRNWKLPVLPSSPEKEPWRGAMQVLVKNAIHLEQTLSEPREDNYFYDMCHIYAFGPSGQIPSNGKSGSTALNSLTRISPRASMNWFSFSKESITWTRWPPTRSQSPDSRIAKYQSNIDGDVMRKAAWSDLLDRLEML
jgi:hypothetical protein